MRIVIAGAGGIGLHLARLLSSANHDIVLIDVVKDVLDYAQQHLDVHTIVGDASSIEVLQEAGIAKTSIFLAVTTRENDNIVSCILAKKLGAKQTIARIVNVANIRSEFKSTFYDLGVDKIISPSLLASQEIVRLIQLTQVTDSFDFENNTISLIGIRLDEPSKYIGRSIDEIKLDKKTDYSPIAILRSDKTILPRNNTILRKGDHLYFIMHKSEIEPFLEKVGLKSRNIKSIMFLGGSVIALEAARRLEYDYNITIVEESEKGCKVLTNELNNTLIIKGDPSNFELLKEEGLLGMDVLVAVTPNSETNIITSLLANNSGVFKTIASVENLDYTHISQNIGVDTIINKKIIAANNIFRYVRKGKVEAIASLHGVDGEVIEFVIDTDSKLTKLPLRKLKLPEQAIIGVVLRDKDLIIPTGDFIFQVNDKVIVLALTEAIVDIENLFR